MRSDRDNIKAGVFVILGVILGLVVIFILADYEQFLEKRQQVQVYYRLADGTRGLKPGAQVTLGNQPIGAVASIDDTTDPHPDDVSKLPPDANAPRVVGKIVTIEIPVRYVLYQNAAIELVVPPLGSGTVLNIRSVGDTRPYDGSAPIRGGLAPSPLTRSLMREAGIGDEQRQQIKVIIANLERITTTLDRDMPEISANVREAVSRVPPLLEKADTGVDDLRLAAADVKAIVTGIRERYGAWVDRLDNITQNVDDTTGRVNKLVADKDPVVRESIDNLRTSSGNVKEITQSVKDNNLKQFNELLDRANSAVANFETTGQEVNSLLVGQRPVLERMLANMNLSAGQLKLAAIEVRRSPWRLLYRPKDEELETDNLYDATRSFALAAEALEASSANLRAVAVRGDDQAAVERSVATLKRMFEKFEQAEDDFWQALRNTSDGVGDKLKSDSNVP